LVLVRINQRSEAVVGEHLAQQAFVHGAVDDVDTRNAAGAGSSRVLRLGDHLRREAPGVLLDEPAQLSYEHLWNQFTVVDQTIPSGDENELDGLQLFGDR